MDEDSKGSSTPNLEIDHDHDNLTVHELRSHYDGIEAAKQPNYGGRDRCRGRVWNDPK